MSIAVMQCTYKHMIYNLYYTILFTNENVSMLKLLCVSNCKLFILNLKIKFVFNGSQNINIHFILRNTS